MTDGVTPVDGLRALSSVVIVGASATGTVEPVAGNDLFLARGILIQVYS